MNKHVNHENLHLDTTELSLGLTNIFKPNFLIGQGPLFQGVHFQDINCKILVICGRQPK